MNVPGGGYRLVDGAWIHPRSRIAAGVAIEPGAVVGADVEIGKGSWIGAGAVIYGPTVLGEDNQVWPTAFLGGPPQDLGYAGQPTRLVVGHRNVFQEGSTAHRASARRAGETVIGDDNFFMARSHIGHDCVVGSHVVLIRNMDLPAFSRIGSRQSLDGSVGIVRRASGEPFAFIGCLAGTSMECEPPAMDDGTVAQPWEINIYGFIRGKFDYKTVNSIKLAYRVLFEDFESGREPDLALVRAEIGNRGGVVSSEVEEFLEFVKSK